MHKYVSDFEIWRLGEVLLLIVLTTKASTQSTKMKPGHLSNAKTAVMSESDSSEISSVATAKSKSSTSRKPGRKAVWRETVITDMVDIICSSEHLRKNLIFRNTSRSRNTAFYTDVVKPLKERLASRGENFPFDVSQTRNKFKKCVAECKKAALTIRTATGIKRFQEEKNLGDWFSQLYSFVKTRDSCIPEMALEPSCSNRGESPETADGTETGENSDSEEINVEGKNSSSKDGDTAPKAQFVPVKRGKKKVKVDPVAEAIETMKQVIEKDPTKDLLEFFKEENERARQHEMRLMQMMMAPPQLYYSGYPAQGAQVPPGLDQSVSGYASQQGSQSRSSSPFDASLTPANVHQSVNYSENNKSYFSL